MLPRIEGGGQKGGFQRKADGYRSSLTGPAGRQGEVDVHNILQDLDKVKENLNGESRIRRDIEDRFGESFARLKADISSTSLAARRQMSQLEAFLNLLSRKQDEMGENMASLASMFHDLQVASQVKKRLSGGGMIDSSHDGDSVQVDGVDLYQKVSDLGAQMMELKSFVESMREGTPISSTGAADAHLGEQEATSIKDTESALFSFSKKIAKLSGDVHQLTNQTADVKVDNSLILESLAKQKTGLSTLEQELRSVISAEITARRKGYEKCKNLITSTMSRQDQEISGIRREVQLMMQNVEARFDALNSNISAVSMSFSWELRQAKDTSLVEVAELRSEVEQLKSTMKSLKTNVNVLNSTRQPSPKGSSLATTAPTASTAVAYDDSPLLEEMRELAARVKRLEKSQDDISFIKGLFAAKAKSKASSSSSPSPSKSSAAATGGRKGGRVTRFEDDEEGDSRDDGSASFIHGEDDVHRHDDSRSHSSHNEEEESPQQHHQNAAKRRRNGDDVDNNDIIHSQSHSRGKSGVHAKQRVVSFPEPLPIPPHSQGPEMLSSEEDGSMLDQEDWGENSSSSPQDNHHNGHIHHKGAGAGGGRNKTHSSIEASSSTARSDMTEMSQGTKDLFALEEQIKVMERQFSSEQRQFILEKEQHERDSKASSPSKSSGRDISSSPSGVSFAAATVGVVIPENEKEIEEEQQQPSSSSRFPVKDEGDRIIAGGAAAGGTGTAIAAEEEGGSSSTAIGDADSSTVDSSINHSTTTIVVSPAKKLDFHSESEEKSLSTFSSPEKNVLHEVEGSNHQSIPTPATSASAHKSATAGSHKTNTATTPRSLDTSVIQDDDLKTSGDDENISDAAITASTTDPPVFGPERTEHGNVNGHEGEKRSDEKTEEEDKKKMYDDEVGEEEEGVDATAMRGLIGLIDTLKNRSDDIINTSDARTVDVIEAKECLAMWDDTILLYESKQLPGQDDSTNSLAESWYTYRSALQTKLKEAQDLVQEEQQQRIRSRGGDSKSGSRRNSKSMEGVSKSGSRRNSHSSEAPSALHEQAPAGDIIALVDSPRSSHTEEGKSGREVTATITDVSVYAEKEDDKEHGEVANDDTADHDGEIKEHGEVVVAAAHDGEIKEHGEVATTAAADHNGEIKEHGEVATTTTTDAADHNGESKEHGEVVVAADHNGESKEHGEVATTTAATAADHNGESKEHGEVAATATAHDGESKEHGEVATTAAADHNGESKEHDGQEGPRGATADPATQDKEDELPKFGIEPVIPLSARTPTAAPAGNSSSPHAIDSGEPIAEMTSSSGNGNDLLRDSLDGLPTQALHPPPPLLDGVSTSAATKTADDGAMISAIQEVADNKQEGEHDVDGNSAPLKVGAAQEVAASSASSSPAKKKEPGEDIPSHSEQKKLSEATIASANAAGGAGAGVGVAIDSDSKEQHDGDDAKPAKNNEDSKENEGESSNILQVPKQPSSPSPSPAKDDHRPRHHNDITAPTIDDAADTIARSTVPGGSPVVTTADHINHDDEDHAPETPISTYKKPPSTSKPESREQSPRPSQLPKPQSRPTSRPRSTVASPAAASASIRDV